MGQPRYVTKVLTASSPTAVCASQTPSGAGNMLINGGSASGGIATLDTSRQVLFTFAADETGHTFVVYGTSEGVPVMQETVAGTTAGTVATTQSFNTVSRISISAAATGAITVGTNGVGATPWQVVNRAVTPLNLGIGVTVLGTVNFTVEYTYDDPSGTYPNPATVTQGYQVTGQYASLIQFPTAWSLSALASKAAATDSSITFPIAAWRLKVNSGTGTAQAIAVQSGDLY